MTRIPPPEFHIFSCRRYLLWFDWLLSLIFFGASAEDFFIYQFYKYRYCERKRFVTLIKSLFIIRRLNKGGSCQIVEDKSIFIEIYRDKLCRDAIASEGLSFSKFYDFYLTHRRVIIKPADGYNGKGIYIIDEGARKEDLHTAFQSFQNHSYVIEEVLKQDGIFQRLNSGTCNSIRVNSLCDGKKVRIVNAILRSGQGHGVVDNICAGGVVAEIDVESGIVVTTFHDLSGHDYRSHPLTHTVMLGREIPKWNSIIETVKEAALRIPDVPYTSWDMAVVEGGRVAIIEGNTSGNFNIQQVCRQHGVLDVYSQFVAEIKHTRKSTRSQSKM